MLPAGFDRLKEKAWRDRTKPSLARIVLALRSMANPSGRAAKRWALAFALAVSGFGGNASAVLLDRGPDMVYDTALNITWTRDASLPGSGNLTWAEANAWVATLGVGWRLPYASVSAGAGPVGQGSVVDCSSATETACRDNEMGYMFYYNLGGNSGDNETGNQTAIGGEALTNIQSYYWSGTGFPFGDAWRFSFLGGGQTWVGVNDRMSAWAVRPGDVAAVPEPGSLLLFGVGALALGLGRRAARRR